MKSKSVLFICPAYFGYEISIKNALVENGFDVDYFDERVSNNSFLKAIFRVKKDLLKIQIDKYYQNLYKIILTKKYDYFLLIKGEVVPESFIKNFKHNNPKAKLIYFTYDSIKNNNKNSLSILKYFDTCYSFDFEDVEAFPFFKLKHLFYTKEFIDNIPDTKLYDISFIGTLHSNRFSIIKNLFAAFEKTYFFCFMPARWFFYYEKLTKKEFKPIQISDVSFDKLSKQQVADVFKKSKSVLDIQRFGQSGLTMRTFEVLATGAILITTNSCIKQVDFYNEDNIIVVDDLEDINKIKEISQSIKLSKKSIFEKEFDFKKYYVNNWVKEFFE